MTVAQLKEKAKESWLAGAEEVPGGKKLWPPKRQRSFFLAALCCI